MWYAPTVITAASGLVVSLSDVKARLREDASDEDALIQDLISEVTRAAESYCNIYLQQRTVDVLCDDWGDLCRLPVGPLASDAVQSISYVDPDGVSQTLDAAAYELRLNGLDAEIRLPVGASWPSIETGSRVTARLQAGYAELPLDVRLALYEQIATRFEHREAGKWAA